MAEIDYDDMCPNCVTPWKCNGPHEPQTETAPGPREDVAVAEVLAAHRLAGLNGYCGCGWAPPDRSTPGPEQHRTHLAEALAPLIAERVRVAVDEDRAAAIEEHAETFGVACSTSRDWLRDRADRRAER